MIQLLILSFTTSYIQGRAVKTGHSTQPSSARDGLAT